MKEVPYSHDRMIEVVKEYPEYEHFNNKEEAVIHAQEKERQGYSAAIMKIGVGTGAGWNVFLKKS